MDKDRHNLLTVGDEYLLQRRRGPGRPRRDSNFLEGAADGHVVADNWSLLKIKSKSSSQFTHKSAVISPLAFQRLESFDMETNSESSGSRTAISQAAWDAAMRCIFCGMPAGSLLGQGEARIFRPHSRFDVEVDRGNVADDEAALLDETENCWDTLGNVGVPGFSNPRESFLEDNACFAHERCASWAVGVVCADDEAGERTRDADHASLECVPEAALVALSKRCSGCRRFGAAVSCHCCSKLYHLPCALAYGGFMDFRSKLFLCPDHAEEVYQLSNATCCWCGELGRIQNLLVCSLCFLHSHCNCLDPPVNAHPSLRAGWQCPDCKLCQHCRTSGDDSKMLVCDVCDKGYHIYCIQPPLMSIPKNGWKCKNCRKCIDCGSKTPGSSQNSRWHLNFSVCDSCHQQRNKGLACSKCGRSYRHLKQKAMLQCIFCKECVHKECDPAAAKSNADYVCRNCLDRQVSPASPFPSSEGSEVVFAKDTVDDPECLLSSRLNAKANFGNAYSRWDLDTNDEAEQPPETTLQTRDDKFKAAGTSGKRKRKKKTTLTSQQSSASLASVASSESLSRGGNSRSEDDFYHAIIIATKSVFVFDQIPGKYSQFPLAFKDICVSCGSFGKDKEGQLIACAQCGQCYHPYCANVKLTVVLIQRGWRCLECIACEGCGKRDDESRLLLCEDCDVAFHLYCLAPPLEHAPYGNWKCQWCARCALCGNSNPGVGGKWFEQYRKCAPCASLESCFACRMRYSENDLILKCPQCLRWLHAACAGFDNEDAVEMALDADWRCKTCRPSGALMALPSISRPDSGRQFLSSEGIILTADGFDVVQTGCAFTKGPAVTSATAGAHESPEAQSSPQIPVDCNNADERSGDLTARSFADAAAASIMDIIASVTASVNRTGDQEESSVLALELSGESAAAAVGAAKLTISQRRAVRRISRIGVGGFAVRPARQAQSLAAKMESTSVGEGEIPSSQSINALEDAFLGAEDSVNGVSTATATDLAPVEKPKRRRRPKKRGELQDSYPSYIQECFFGGHLLDVSNFNAESTPCSVTTDLDEKPTPLDDSSQRRRHDSCLKLPANLAPTAKRISEEQDQVLDDQFNELNDCFPQDLPHDADINGLLGMLFSEQGQSIQTSGRQTNPLSSSLGSKSFQRLLGKDYDFGDDLESATLSEIRNTQEGQHNALRNAAAAKPTSFPQQDLASRIAVQSAQFAGPRGSLSVACLPHAPPTDGSLSLGLFNAAAMAGVVGVKSTRPSFTSLSPQAHMQQPQQQQALLYPQSPQQQRVVASAVGLVSPGGVYSLPAAQPFARSQSFAITSPNSSGGSVDWSRSAASGNAVGFESVGGSAASKSNRMDKWEDDEALGDRATISAVLYANLCHANLRISHPAWAERSKQISKLWRDLPEGERAPFLQRAKENRSLHRQEQKATITRMDSKSNGLSESSSQPSPSAAAAFLSTSAYNVKSELVSPSSSSALQGSSSLCEDAAEELERFTQMRRNCAFVSNIPIRPSGDVSGHNFGQTGFFHYQQRCSFDSPGIRIKQESPFPSLSSNAGTGTLTLNPPSARQNPTESPLRIGKADVCPIQEELDRMKSQKKSLMSRRRQLKKTNEDLNESDRKTLFKLNHDILEAQKILDNARRMEQSSNGDSMQSPNTSQRCESSGHSASTSFSQQQPWLHSFDRGSHASSTLSGPVAMSSPSSYASQQTPFSAHTQGSRGSSLSVPMPPNTGHSSKPVAVENASHRSSSETVMKNEANPVDEFMASPVNPTLPSGSATAVSAVVKKRQRHRKEQDVSSIGLMQKLPSGCPRARRKTFSLPSDVVDTVRHLVDFVCFEVEGDSAESGTPMLRALSAGKLATDDPLLKRLFGSSRTRTNFGNRTISSIADIVSEVVQKAAGECVHSTSISSLEAFEESLNAVARMGSSDVSNANVTADRSASSATSTATLALPKRSRQRRLNKLKLHAEENASPQKAVDKLGASSVSNRLNIPPINTHPLVQSQPSAAVFDEFERFADNLAVLLAQVTPLPLQEPPVDHQNIVCPAFGSSCLPGGSSKNHLEGSELGSGALSFTTDYYAGEFWVPKPLLRQPLVSPAKNRRNEVVTERPPSKQKQRIESATAVQLTECVKAEKRPVEPYRNVERDADGDLVWSSSPEPDDNNCCFLGLKPFVPKEGQLSPNFRLVAPVPFRPVPCDPPSSPEPTASVSDAPKSESAAKHEPEVTISLELTESAAKNVGFVMQGLAALLRISAPEYDVHHFDTPPPTPDKLLVAPATAAAAVATTASTTRQSSLQLAVCCRHCSARVDEATAVRRRSSSETLAIGLQLEPTLLAGLQTCYASVFADSKQEQLVDAGMAYAGDNRELLVHANSLLKSTDKLTLPAKDLLSPNLQVGLNERRLLLESLSSTHASQRWKASLLACRGAQKSPMISVDQALRDAGIAISLPQIVDPRRCAFCEEMGDGNPEIHGRLLQMDADEWVHVNCAFWSAEVYETQNGLLINVAAAYRRGQHTVCTSCGRRGATLRCCCPSCELNFHFQCALDADCTFLKDKTIICPDHSPMFPENVVDHFAMFRKIYIERDESGQIAKLFQQGDAGQLTLRVGSLIFQNLGQLLPHQLKTFHTPNFIFPVGYSITRIYWSVWEPGKRQSYTCSVADRDGQPEFLIEYCKPGFPYTMHRNQTAKEAWDNILSVIEMRRENTHCLKLFSRLISGESLFGLQEQSILKMIESLPGVEQLLTYNFKFGRSPLMDLPLAVNPSGCARCEPRFRTYIKRSCTLNAHHANTCASSSLWQQINMELSLYAINRQVSYSKYSQYRKMQAEWRSNVFLARSRIQGLGLYAAKDIDMNCMIIEYIGEVIRNEVAERREKLYNQQNRGIYMFRIDTDQVLDATLAGGPARYINHSCDPNCLAESVTVGDRDKKIIIISNRPISKGEELTYDYQFDVEDEQHKIACLCGAPNCKKWMN